MKIYPWRLRKDYNFVTKLLLRILEGKSRVRRETIIFLEQGKHNPSLKLAYHAARALKTTIDEIFIFDD